MTFRSQQMTHFQLIIPREGGWEAVNQLGQIQLAHIQDCGDPSNRPFFSQLKRCQEALQKIQLLNDAVVEAKMQVEEFDENQPLFVEKLQEIWKQSSQKYGVQQLRLLDRIETEVMDQWVRFQDIKIRIDKLKSGKKVILQQIACYETANNLFGQDLMKRNSENYYRDNVAAALGPGVSFLVGVLPAEAEIRLNRMIYRVSRGYACVKNATNFKFAGLRNFQEVVTLVIYPNSDTNVLEKKLKRVMQTFCTNNFILSQIETNAASEIERLAKEYYEVINLLQMNEKQLTSFMERIRKIEYIQNWRTYLWKERQLYSGLDKLEVREMFFRGQVYVPKDQAAKLSIKLSKMIPAPSLHEIPSTNPPTAFRVTEYTAVAQEITDTYGIPRYQEFNPAMFTVVTFPFFFGIMFGDIAHGGVLLAFGLFLIFFEETVKRSPLKMLASLKYIVTMMGFFAFYCGFIYNDFMGMNINLFGSCYDPPPKYDEEDGPLVPRNMIPEVDCIYPFGLDPIWGRSSNELVYFNTLKMKISVIIAVLHMTVGIILKAANAIHFKRNIELIFEFIPQIIFMVLLFGYMDFLIVLKWLTIWDQGQNPERWAPSIITTMMNIGLELGKTSTIQNGASNMYGTRGDTIQDTIQLGILLIALVCIPIMLLPKPIIEINRLKSHKKKHPLEQNLMEQEMQQDKKLNPSETSALGPNHQQHDPSEIFVHQLIETIEFVLGTISNTASYLRLWALSLAHSQLAKVFFEKTLMMGYGPQTFISIPMMIIGFYLLAWITFGILMCMDTMECFLHSLRLHWVEFQNKFYKGDGYKYKPFSFKAYIKEQKAIASF